MQLRDAITASIVRSVQQAATIPYSGELGGGEFVEHWSTNILPTNEATLTTFT